MVQSDDDIIYDSRQPDEIIFFKQKVDQIIYLQKHPVCR